MEKKRTKQKRAAARGGEGGARGRGPASRTGTERSGPSWTHGKGPIFRFVGLFVLLMAVFWASTFLDVLEKGFFPAYLRFNAATSVAVLNVFNEGASAQQTSVVSPRYSVNIKHGCDAIEPSALFIAAVLAFPGSWWSKFPGLIAGTLFLAVLNIIRIVTLFYTGIYAPRWFETMHVDVWQPAFIVVALVLWVAWAWWATRGSVPQPRTAPTATT